MAMSIKKVPTVSDESQGKEKALLFILPRYSVYHASCLDEYFSSGISVIEYINESSERRLSYDRP